jgi:hypothetical protein
VSRVFVAHKGGHPFVHLLSTTSFEVFSGDPPKAFFHLGDPFFRVLGISPVWGPERRMALDPDTISEPYSEKR